MSASIDQLKEANNTIFVQVAAVYLLVAAAVGVVSSIDVDLSLGFVLGSFVAWAVIGWSQFALFNALHEGLHNRFGRPHRDLLAYALTAYTVGFDESYRKLHLDHHKFFGDPLRDPDYPNYGNFPVSQRQFIQRLFLNLCGWYALLQFLGIRQGASMSDEAGGNDTPAKGSGWRIVIAQIFVLAVFSLTVGWGYYFWLWLFPIVTFGKFFSSTRAFCEHASPDDEQTIRTITGSFLGEKILGVFCFHYHAEHHRYVAVPYTHLAEANAMLADSVYAPPEPGEPRYEHYRHGYWQLLYGWFRKLPL
ncbi:MAG: fatty acid desaturase [Halioglobus sp.]